MDDLASKSSTPVANAVPPPQKTATNKRPESPENVTITAETGPSPTNKHETRTCKPDDTPLWRMILEGVVVAVGIYVAFIYSRQLTQMIESNRISREAFLTSQRPFITIGRKDGVLADFLMPDDPHNGAAIVIYFQNNGHLPAKFNWGLTTDIAVVMPSADIPPIKATHPFGRMTRTRSKKNGSINYSTGAVMLGGDAMYVGDAASIPADTIDKLKHRGQTIMINGAFEYCDALGNYSCREFNLYYQEFPIRRFSLMDDRTCFPGIGVPRTEAKDPDVEEISPCDESMR
jgi:hypothetical protein